VDLSLLSKIKKARNYLSDAEIEELLGELESEYNKRFLKAKRRKENAGG